MSEPRKVDRRGIEIPADVAEAAGVPEDLDADAVTEYAVPDTLRRRTAGLVYAAGALMVALGALAGLGSGMWVLAVGLLVIAAYHRAAGVTLAVRESRALEAANASAGFPVGHASATLGFDGALAKPVWNVLVFSADDPPSQRALVRVDAIGGDIVEKYSERIEQGAE